jgi:Uma2 family endonuclease
MPSRSLRRKLTYEDFVRFPDDGLRHEIIDGVHFVSPAPFTPHQRVVGNLYFIIRSFLEKRRLGSIWLAPFDVVLSMHDIVEPDLVYLSKAAEESILTEKHIRGAPDLLIEVLSKSTRRSDLVRKRACYERCGVPEYWIVDPEEETVRVFRRQGSGYGDPILLSRAAGDILTTPIIPGLEIALEKAFG